MASAHLSVNFAPAGYTANDHLFDKNYLFNEHSMSALKSRVIDALSLLSKQVETVRQPFSGISPQALAERFSSIDLARPLATFSAALDELKQVYLDDAIYFHDPKYMAHLNCPIVYPAVVAELILATINSSLDTWDQSAGGTLIEQSIIDWTAAKIDLGERADGVFTSGGTQSNLMALLLARDHFAEKQLGHDIKSSGLPANAGRFKILTSSASHFSVQKSAAILGLGYDAVIPVAVNKKFQMDPLSLASALNSAKMRGDIPIAVVATTGTTDFGSIDPVEPIAAICKQHKIWLHVDAAYGCGLLISNQYRERIKGIEKADSVTVDYHKSFFQPVSCSAFLVRKKENLKYVTHHADYLNPLRAETEGTPNLVSKSIQTTRRFDALKLWMTLRIMGEKLLGSYFDQVIDHAAAVHKVIKADPELEVLNQPEISAIVFRFFANEQKNTCELNLAIRKAIQKQGLAMIAGTKVNSRQYLKVTLLNPSATLEQTLDVFELIKSTGRSLIEKATQQ